MDTEAVLVLIEIFFPLFGIIVIVILAGMYKGKKKWLVLIPGPGILLALHTLLLHFSLIDGNLLTVAIYGIMLMGTWYYYLILLAVGLIKGWKVWKEKKYRPN